MIRSKSSRRILAGALFAAAFLAPSIVRAEADMARFIPSDSAFALWAPDLASVQAAGKASAFGQLLADPASAKIVSMIEEAIEEQKAEMTEEEIGRVEEALKAIKGGAAFYMAFNPTDSEEPFISIVAELDDEGKAWFDRLTPEIGKELTEVTKSTISVGDTTVYQIKGLMDAKEDEASETPQADPLGLNEEDQSMDSTTEEAAEEPQSTTINYAIVGGRFLYMSSVTDSETISRQVALVTGANTDSLSTRSDAATAGGLTPDKNSVGLFLNAQKGLELLIEEADNGEVEDLKGKLATVGALDVQSLYGKLSFDGADLKLNVTATLPTGTHGIMDALFAANSVSIDRLNTVPSDAPSAGVFYFDFARLWDAALAAAETFSPGSSAYAQLPIISVQSQYGVDPLNGILKNIQGTHFSYNMLPDPAAPTPDPENPLAGLQRNNSPVFISYANGDITFNAVRTLLTNLSKDPNYGTSIELTDSGDRLEVRMAEALRSAEGPSPTFAFTKDGFVIAQSDLALSDMTRTLEGKQPGKLGETAEFMKAVAQLDRTGLLAYSYMSGAAWGVTVDELKKVLDAAGGMSGEGAEFAEALPSGEVFTHYLGTVRQTLHRKESALVLEWNMEGKK
ncbi:hypothetical protein GC173_02440 [bacterium]|nr:hypothetical protein [bacterium]